VLVTTSTKKPPITSKQKIERFNKKIDQSNHHQKNSTFFIDYNYETINQSQIFYFKHIRKKTRLIFFLKKGHRKNSNIKKIIVVKKIISKFETFLK